MGKTIVVFVCVHNSCRSQMAEAWAKALGSDVIEAYSAGTEKYPEVKPFASRVMEEKGIDMLNHHPKLLDDVPCAVDILISMGCRVKCPYVACKFQEDWGIDDPSGGSVENFRKTRDILKSRVKTLVADIKSGKYN